MNIARIVFASATAALICAGGAVAARAQMPCANEIMPLRNAVEQAGLAVKAVVDKKAPREEICNQIKRFAATEAKFVKYLEANQSWCAIPPEAIKQVKAGHSNTLKMRGQACAAGPGPAAGRPAPPPGPGLSEALGTSRGPVLSDSNSDRGTYNTLTGNPLQR